MSAIQDAKTRQQKMIRFVAQHNSGFATPLGIIGVYVYSFAIDRAGRVELVRETALSFREVRNILGY